MPPRVENLEPRLFLSVDADPARLVPVLVVPGMFSAMPRKLDFDGLKDFFRRRTVDPEDLEPKELMGDYAPILGELESRGYERGKNLFFAAYDWRLPLAPADKRADGWLNLDRLNFTDDKYKFGVEYLQHWVEQARSQWISAYGSAEGFKVNVISHDMGGLLVRSFVQSKFYARNHAGTIDKVVTLGTPHQGFVDAFIQQDEALEDFLDALGVSRKWAKAAEYTGVASIALGIFAPGLLAALPLFTFITRSIKDPPEDVEEVKNTLLSDLNGNTGRFSSLVGEVITAGATGVKTRKGLHRIAGRIKQRFTQDGDGVVLAASALLPELGVTRLYSLVNHRSLISDDAVMADLVGDVVEFAAPSNPIAPTGSIAIGMPPPNVLE